MFLGEYYRTKDNKGRVFVPSNFREELRGGIVLSKGFDEKCLFILREGWQTLQNRIMSVPIARKTSGVLKMVLSSAREAEVDPQGRIKIPQELSDHAGLDKDIVLIGVSDRIELWAKEKWEEYYSKADTSFTGESRTFEELGF